MYETLTIHILHYGTTIICACACFPSETFCELFVSEPSPLSVSDVVCEDPTPPSGVTVVQPHNTTVSSVIIYQCQQSGFTPSVPSSVCGEDERWSPDPSQVVCVTSTGMLMEILQLI